MSVVLSPYGPSLASPASWNRILCRVQALIDAGQHPVLCCSALAGVRDSQEAMLAAVEARGTAHRHLRSLWDQHEHLCAQLGINMIETLGAEWSALEDVVSRLRAWAPVKPTARARIIACGELMSTKLGATWLQRMGVHTRWCDAREWLLAGEDDSGAHDIDFAPHATRALLGVEDFEATITQRSIASTPGGETVLLGPGGQDSSAALLASLLEAERLEIWTDAPGLFTADPRETPDARLISHATYDEAAILARSGASVLHPDGVESARKSGIPVIVRRVEQPRTQGTRIGERGKTAGIKAIASRSGLCLVRMRNPAISDSADLMAELSACFSRHGLSMDMVKTSSAEIGATIDLNVSDEVRGRLPLLVDDLSQLCEPSLRHGLACVTLVGTKVTEDIKRILPALQFLHESEIDLVGHSPDDTHTSFVLEESLAKELVSSMHALLFGEESDSSAPTWRELHSSQLLRSAVSDDSQKRIAASDAGPVGISL